MSLILPINLSYFKIKVNNNNRRHKLLSKILFKSIIDLYILCLRNYLKQEWN